MPKWLGIRWTKNVPEHLGTKARNDMPTPRELSVFTCTWNVGNKAPDESVRFLQTARGYDLVVVGLQEATFPVKSKATKHPKADESSDSPSVATTPGAVVSADHLRSHAPEPHARRNNFSIPAVGGMLGAAVGAMAADFGGNEYASRAYLLDLCQSQLGEDFVVVGMEALLQMRLIALVRSDLRHAVTDVKIKDAATGVGNMVGNKGGLAMCLRFWDTRLCFVSCHLAAHQGKWEDRNEDVRMIFRGIRMGNKELEMHMQYDHTFWMGDMNYRLDFHERSERHDWERAYQLMQNHEWGELLKADQLRPLIEEETILSGFQEGSIDFAPTFKLYRGDKSRSDDEPRSPATESDRSQDSPHTHEAHPGCSEETKNNDANKNAVSVASHCNSVPSALSASPTVSTSGKRTIMSKTREEFSKMRSQFSFVSCTSVPPSPKPPKNPDRRLDSPPHALDAPSHSGQSSDATSPVHPEAWPHSHQSRPGSNLNPSAPGAPGSPRMSDPSGNAAAHRGVSASYLQAAAAYAGSSPSSSSSLSGRRSARMGAAAAAIPHPSVPVESMMTRSWGSLCTAGMPLAWSGVDSRCGGVSSPSEAEPERMAATDTDCSASPERGSPGASRWVHPRDAHASVVSSDVDDKRDDSNSASGRPSLELFELDDGLESASREVPNAVTRTRGQAPSFPAKPSPLALESISTTPGAWDGPFEMELEMEESSDWDSLRSLERPLLAAYNRVGYKADGAAEGSEALGLGQSGAGQVDEADERQGERAGDRGQRLPEEEPRVSNALRSHCLSSKLAVRPRLANWQTSGRSGMVDFGLFALESPHVRHARRKSLPEAPNLGTSPPATSSRVRGRDVRLGLPPPYKLLMHNKSKQSAEGLAVSLPGGLKQWYSKKRVPAYTDRILWHSHPGRGNELCQTSYGAFPETATGDHTPVWAGFKLLPTWQVEAAEKENAQVTFKHLKVVLSKNFKAQLIQKLAERAREDDGLDTPTRPRPSLELIAKSAEQCKYMLVTYSNETTTTEKSRSRFFSKPVMASFQDKHTTITFTNEDLPEVAIAPALQSPLGAVSRHVQLLLVAHTPSLQGMKFFPNPRSQSYIPGDVTPGMTLLGQCLVPLTEDSSSGPSKGLEREFACSLCKYSRRIGSVSGAFSIDYSRAPEGSRAKSFRHADAMRRSSAPLNSK